jgi:SAM-dependent methyltransferase
MKYSFPQYLLSKQSVDDRALNRTVLAALQASLPRTHLTVVEVGAGIGSMLRRMLRWQLLPGPADYTLVDEMPENIAYARRWLPQSAARDGVPVEKRRDGDLHLGAAGGLVRAHFIQADVFDYIHSAAGAADLLIAHAFLDLLPLPESLPGLFALLKPGGLAWLTINFDGLTSFEPVIDPALDARIEQLFHQSMDERITNGVRSGDSRTGRRLFGYLQAAGATILSAGASDWLVYPQQGRYPQDEATFLRFILHFFETSLSGQPDLDQVEFSAWLAQRRAQVDEGKLIYIAHQMDFLVRV